jgi:hypothetical protein
VALLATFVGLAAGCQQECPPQEDVIVYQGTICTQEGLTVDGALMVPADPLHYTMSTCGQTSLQLIGQGYRACCDGECCEWHPDTEDFELSLNAPCADDSDCGFGLLCRTREVEGGEATLCVYGALDEPCDYQHFCDADLYCHPTGHVCKALAPAEGLACDPSVMSCASGMFCVCGSSLAGCYCYDGSEWDPCEQGTCQDGLYCVNPADGAGKPGCHDGTKGDPCSWTVQCQGKLECLQVGLLTYCVELLGAYQQCAPSSDEYTRCAPGLVCNEAFDPPVCRPPGEDGDDCHASADCVAWAQCILPLGKCYDGTDGDPCSLEAECSGGRHCIPWLGACSSGHLGDPCVADTCMPGLSCHVVEVGKPEAKCLDGIKGDPCQVDDQCNPGLICMEKPGGKVCVQVSGEGEPCAVDPAALVECSDGLLCNPALEPPACTLPGLSGAACLTGEQCAEGHWCLADLSVCTSGNVAAPCSTNEDCLPGLQCDAAALLCGLGYEGMPCTAAAECFTGYVCSTADGMCHDGMPTDPCLTAVDCAPASFCVQALGQCQDGTAGAACDDVTQCAQGLACTDSVCVEQPEGELPD